jgi:septum formation protein
MMASMDLILASTSPRRSELLHTAGIPFRVRARPVVEKRMSAEEPLDYAVRLAREKAEAAWEDAGEIVLGADTIVVLETSVLEKPANIMEARRMLQALAGKEHTVITGICLRHPGGAISDSEATRVRFSALDDEEIEAYLASGEPMDIAGDYGIEGLASMFIERIDGCYFNVMGLPISRVYRHLKTLRPHWQSQPIGA